MNDFISIKEFAERVNISKAKAYQLANLKENEKFCGFKDGYKAVNVEILKKYMPTENKADTETQTETDTPPKEKDQQNSAAETAATDKLIIYLETENKRLQEENKRLAEQLQQMSLKFAELATRSQEIADKALTTTTQAQFLQATETVEKKKGIFKRLLKK